MAGVAVAISGATALVGAPDNGDVASTAGAVFVFEQGPDGAWTEVQQLTASTFGAGDDFGRALALSGDRAIVGAPSHDGAAGSNQGAAYVFERAGGTWSETAELLPSDAVALDEVGWSVAIDGDHAAIGSYKNDDLGTNAGAVYVFERIGGAWIEVQKLHASDASEGEQLGFALALRGTTLLAGADREDPSGNGGGAVYVFERAGGAWNQTQKLKGDDTIALDHFGWSVALDGDVAAIGAHHAESATDPFSWDEGAVYVFERAGGVWSQAAQLSGADTTASDELGYSVGVSGDRVLVGAPDQDQLGNNAGAAYLFGRDAGGAWEQLAKVVATDGQAGDLVGRAVALSGDRAILGAFGDDDQGSNSGAAYLVDVEPLSGPAASLSLSAGGAQPLALDAGRDHAGEIHWVLGSLTGTGPGIPVGPGLLLPLVPDVYFALSLNQPNQVPLVSSLATLNAVGHGAAAFLIPPGTDPALAGAVAHHAFVAIDPLAAAATFASNALPVSLVP
jgi:hypothetical protein